MHNYGVDRSNLHMQLGKLHVLSYKRAFTYVCIIIRTWIVYRIAEYLGRLNFRKHLSQYDFEKYSRKYSKQYMIMSMAILAT